MCLWAKPKRWKRLFIWSTRVRVLFFFTCCLVEPPVRMNRCNLSVFTLLTTFEALWRQLLCKASPKWLPWSCYKSWTARSEERSRAGLGEVRLWYWKSQPDDPAVQTNPTWTNCNKACERHMLLRNRTPKSEWIDLLSLCLQGWLLNLLLHGNSGSSWPWVCFWIWHSHREPSALIDRNTSVDRLCQTLYYNRGAPRRGQKVCKITFRKSMIQTQLVCEELGLDLD